MGPVNSTGNTLQDPEWRSSHQAKRNKCLGYISDSGKQSSPENRDQRTRGNSGGLGIEFSHWLIADSQLFLSCYHSGDGRSFSHIMKSVAGGVPPSRRNLVAHCARCPWLCMQICIMPSATEK